ncbi:MAG: family 43 glycosylhydrolase [Mangrovibacterium sp.]
MKTGNNFMTTLSALIIFTTILSSSAGSEPEEKLLSTADYLSAYTYKNTRGVGGVSKMGDPYVFWDDATSKWYMTGTSNKRDASGKGEITLWSSLDLISWDSGTAILPIDNISWRDQNRNAGLWGGEIHKKGDTYYLYYSVWCDTSKVSGTHTPRIGVATCSSVNGTYKDKGEPLFNYGYSVIDNHLFRDGDKTYFCYVRDATDNIVNGQYESHIYIVEMNNDWMSVKDESESVLLIKPEKTWERQTNTDNWYWAEACWMQKMPNDKYYLFYSCNKFSSHDYAIGYAVNDSPQGPFVKNENNPWLMTCSEKIAGPGNNSFFRSRDGKEMFTAYHLLSNPEKPSGDRYLNIDRVGLREDGSVYISGPTTTAQPLPSGEKPGHTLISGEATVTVNSTKSGSPSMLNDGEIVVINKYTDYQWLSSSTDKNEFVKMEWISEQKINGIYIYNSIFTNYKSSKINIEFSDGRKITDIPMATANGEATIINLNKLKTKSIKITIAQKGFNQLGMGFSEIMVFGD